MENIYNTLLLIPSPQGRGYLRYLSYLLPDISLRRGQKGRGFTLIEVLISIAILSIVLAAIYSTFFLAHKAIDGMDESMVKLQESRRALDILKCELDSAYVTSDEHTFFRMSDRDIFGKGASQLEFTTFSTLRPGLSRISYYVEEKDGKLNLLKKIESPYSTTGEDKGFAIIEDLSGFTVEAKYDDDTWVRTWDTEINRGKPPEIRISLSMAIKGKQVTLSDISMPKIGGSI
jgi:prepilin-type N-terminal cleavage/methylation domain-containing protein